MLPVRTHRRQRARSLSLTRREEELKEVNRERHLREQAERKAIASIEARKRAERDAKLVRRRNEELREKEIRRLERIDAEERERERERRRRREREERERVAAAIIRRRRQDAERDRLAQEMINREEERQWRAEERRRREVSEERRLVQAERERLERLQRLRIPRAPRHRPVVDYSPRVSFEEQARASFEDRGDRILNDAIRAEQMRQAERREPNGWNRRRLVDGGLRRRDTVAVGERRVFDDDRYRFGWRWR
ncbi:MAG: hypothetical protein Q9167_004014 [Letrouitia subvulpina]